MKKGVNSIKNRVKKGKEKKKREEMQDRKTSFKVQDIKMVARCKII